MLLFQCVGMLAFALLVLGLLRFKVEWSGPGFGWAFAGGFRGLRGFLDFLCRLGEGQRFPRL